MADYFLVAGGLVLLIAGGEMLVRGAAGPYNLYYAYRQERAGAPDGHRAAFEKREAHDEVLDCGSGAAAAVVEQQGLAGQQGGSLWPSLVLAMVGLVVVVFGGKLLVEGAIGTARSAGLSETIIGLTIVAIGTSLPELVTSVVAAIRRHSDVSFGNVLGSNINNIIGIGGLTAVIAPTTIPAEVVSFDSPGMLAVSAALLVVARTGYRISRGEGALLLAAYIGYLVAIWP